MKHSSSRTQPKPASAREAMSLGLTHIAARLIYLGLFVLLVRILL